MLVHSKSIDGTPVLCRVCASIWDTGVKTQKDAEFTKFITWWRSQTVDYLLLLSNKEIKRNDKYSC